MDARLELDVVDDEVDVLAREFDAREGDHLDCAEETRQEHGRDILPERSAVNPDEVVSGLGEDGDRVAEVFEGVAEGDERAVVGGVVEELLDFRDEGVRVALPVGVAVDDRAGAVVDRLEAAAGLRTDVESQLQSP